MKLNRLLLTPVIKKFILIMINLTKLFITEDIVIKQVAFSKLGFFSLMSISNNFSTSFTDQMTVAD